MGSRSWESKACLDQDFLNKSVDYSYDASEEGSMQGLQATQLQMYSLLMKLKSQRERDDTEKELEKLKQFYEDDMGGRDKDLEELRFKILDIGENLAVTKKERIEAINQRDELLKQNYTCRKEVERLQQCMLEETDEKQDLKEKLETARDQIKQLRNERDEALQLWNSSVEERKKLHQEMALMIQARDASLRKAFMHQEEINQLKAECDTWRRQASRRTDTMCHGCTQRRDLVLPQKSMRHDSGFSAGSAGSSGMHVEELIPHGPTQAQRRVEAEMKKEVAFEKSAPAANKQENKTRIEIIPEVEEYEERAICIDLIDSRLGLKLENAVDEPRVMIAHVNRQLEQNANLRKHDRILSVNAHPVIHADKKTVEKLIKETTGRTVTMVVRREKSSPSQSKIISDVDIFIGKQQQSLGLLLDVCIREVKENGVEGINKLNVGDSVSKINSQDASMLLCALLTKLAKKMHGRLTFRVKRNPSTGEEYSKQNGENSHHAYVSNSPTKRRRGSGSDNSSYNSMASDESSLFSYSSSDKSVVLDNSLDVSQPEQKIETYLKELEKPDIKVSGSHDSLFAPTDEAPTNRPKYLPLKKPNSDRRRSASISRDDLQRRISHQREIEAANGTRPKSSFIFPAENEKYLAPEDVQRGIDLDAKALKRSISNIYEKNRRAKENFIRSCPNTPMEKRASLAPSHDGKDHRADSICSSHVADDESSLNLSEAGSRFNLPSYATLPKRYKKKEELKSRLCQQRLLRLEKRSNESVGFTICGGNKIGIYVDSIEEGGMADKGGLQVGDRLLHLNSSDMSKATLDYATRIFLSHSHSTRFRLEVKKDPNYAETIAQQPHDSLYVRCLHDFEPSSRDDQHDFTVGDMFHITSTMTRYNTDNQTWHWYGERVIKTKDKLFCGYLPRIENFKSSKSSSQSENAEAEQISPSTSSKKTGKLDEVKRWLQKRPKKKNREQKIQPEEKSIREESNLVYYEVLLEEPVLV